MNIYKIMYENTINVDFSKFMMIWTCSSILTYVLINLFENGVWF